MRIVPVLAVLVISGCLGATDPDSPPGELPALVSMDCPTFPDGTPIDCSGTAWTEAQTDRPAIASGWKCLNTWGEGELLTELWNTRDGDLGFYWEWKRWKADGLAFQRLAIYLSESEGKAVHVPYQEKGFVSLGETFSPSGDVDVHQTFRILRAWVGDGTDFDLADNVEFIVTAWGGETWMVPKITTDSGTYYVELMQPDPETDEHSQWGAPKWEGVIDGDHYIIQSTGNGIKYNNHDYEAMKLRAGGCGLT